MNIRPHARGSLIGLAVGDALGQPTEGKTLTEIKSQWGQITDFLSGEPAGSDDTEYAIFSANLLLKYGKELNSDKIAQAWREEIASQTGGFKGAGFSELAAVENLRAGLNPPLCGEHIHAWSDGLAMRVAPFGIAAANDPELAVYLAKEDGVVSHSGEGVYSGQAVAAAVAVGMSGVTLKEVFQTTLALIPNDSWTYRAISTGIEIGVGAKDVWDALQPLYDQLVCDYYPWADLAPEALGLTFGVLAAAQGDFVESVLGGVNIGRDTDTNAAIAGAIAGAMVGIDQIPEKWTNQIQTIKGTCIHSVADTKLETIADQLAKLAEEWRGR